MSFIIKNSISSEAEVTTRTTAPSITRRYDVEGSIDRSNVIFLLRNALNNLSMAVDNLVNPVSKISEEARSHLTFRQRVAIENSFSLRTVNLKRQLASMRLQLAQPSDRIFSDLNRIIARLEILRNSYLWSERTFGLYIDLLHTKGLAGNVGKILKGYERLAEFTLRLFLSPLGYEIPTVVVYLEQIGDGAAILRHDISLFDSHRNPCAIIKLPQSSLAIPRSSLLHEVGHQLATIVNHKGKNLNREGADLIYNTVRAAGGSSALANYFRYCHSEIIADQFAVQLTNWLAAITLYNIYSGSSGSSLGGTARMFQIYPRDPHLMGFLRIRCAVESTRQILRRGPWDQLEKAIDILYPINSAPEHSLRVIRESLPLLPAICKSLSRSKLACFGGNKSFEDMYPMSQSLVPFTKELLNNTLSTSFSQTDAMLKNPILTMMAYGTLQMLGGKSLYWITDEMRRWLIALGEKGEAK
jgi:hypothetical protein